MNSIKRQARIAGLIYFVMGLIAPIGLMLVPNKLIVSGDPAATAERIRASESLFRIGMATELIHQAIAVYLVLALYKLFKPVNEYLAKQMVMLGALVSVPIMFLNVVNDVAALTLIEAPGFLSAFDTQQLEALAYFFLRLHSNGINVASVFWGLWLFPFGLLVMRCGFIPRFLGVLMIIAGIGYVISAFTTILLPQYEKAVGQVTIVMAFGELPIMFWLLIWGAREKTATSARTQPA